MKPTPDEARNGWDAASLAAYHEQRDREIGNPVAGNVVTAFTRRPPPIRHENVSAYDPARW